MFGYLGEYSLGIVPSFLGVFGFFIFIKMSDLNHQYDSPIELNNKIAEIERIYNQYSDVKVFVKKFRAMVNAIDIKKKNMCFNFKTIIIVFGVLGVLLAFAMRVYYK